MVEASSQINFSNNIQELIVRIVFSNPLRWIFLPTKKRSQEASQSFSTRS